MLVSKCTVFVFFIFAFCTIKPNNLQNLFNDMELSYVFNREDIFEYDMWSFYRINFDLVFIAVCPPSVQVIIFFMF